MLNAFLRLDLSVNTSSCGSLKSASVILVENGGLSNIPAAAAGSAGLLTLSAEGLSVLLDVKGLLLRRSSDCRL